MAEPIRSSPSPSPAPLPAHRPAPLQRNGVEHQGATVKASPVGVSVRDSFNADTGLNAQARGTGPGGVELDASVNGPRLTLEGRADAKVGLSGVDVKLEVDVNATLAEAGAGARRTFTVEVPGGERFDITVDLRADGMVGADGKLKIDLNIGPGGVTLKAGAEGFLGARAGLTGGITVSHEGRQVLQGSATLNGTAGIGGKAEANLSFRGGNVEFNAGAEATAGLGLGFEVDGSLNAKNAARAALEVTNSLAPEGVAWAKDRVKDAQQWLGTHGGNARDWVGDRFSDVGGFIDKHNPLPWP